MEERKSCAGLGKGEITMGQPLSVTARELERMLLAVKNKLSVLLFRSSTLSIYEMKVS